MGIFAAGDTSTSMTCGLTVPERVLRWRVANREFKRALDILARTGDKGNEATCLNSLGQFQAIYSARNRMEWQAGIENLNEALEFVRKIDNGNILISCHVNLAEAYKSTDRETACEHLKESEQDPKRIEGRGLRKQVRALRLYLGCQA